MTEPVLLDITDGVARLTLNRPERGNAIDQPMADALVAMALRSANDPDVRCVVLTGARKMFSVGGALAVKSDDLALRMASGAVTSMGAARRLLQESSNSGIATQMDRKLASIAAAGESA